jgi:uncharacterized radical SAM protein YgiQ
VTPLKLSDLMPTAAKPLFSYPQYWAECFGPAPFLPMSRAEMDELGWDSCDVIIVTGDAYVDHPSFGMAVIGRFLEAQGFRVGIIAQPNWRDPAAFTALGKPNLFFGVTGGNMDSLINRYTADLRLRSDDAYTPGGEAGKRPDRSVIVYSQRCRQAYKDTPIVIGGIEASLRRIAQYDYWSNEVRRSILIDSAADILLYGNAERAIAEVAHQLALGKPVATLKAIRGTAVLRDATPGGWTEIDSTRIDWPSKIDQVPHWDEPNPYAVDHSGSSACASGQTQNARVPAGITSATSSISGQSASDTACAGQAAANKSVDDDVQPIRIIPMPLQRKAHQEGRWDAEHTVIRLPSFEKVSKDAALYAHASRVLHQEANPYNAKPLVQKHGTKEVWVNPPPIPLETEELDGVFDLPYARLPHPLYDGRKIPAYEMIQTSVNIMRGCFGGCTFCSITEHEGRIIQSRSQDSILREIEKIRDTVPGFTGAISDLGGPTANMYRLQCKSEEILKSCKRLSCVHPTICKNLETSHKHTTELYREARKIPGVKRIAIASGLRYDLAVRDLEYVKELVTHHVGGYLKIAPEHSEDNVLNKMMKPGMGAYDEFKRLFEKYSREAGKKQYLIPYFIAGHPGCEDEDMLNLALWLKDNNFRVDQVQTFYPSPMALATAMYFSERNPLQKLSYKSAKLFVAKDLEQRRLQKAYLRYHDEKGWDRIRQSLRDMGRHDLIGNGPRALVPEVGEKPRQSPKARKNPARGGKLALPSKVKASKERRKTRP